MPEEPKAYMTRVHFEGHYFIFETKDRGLTRSESIQAAWRWVAANKERCPPFYALYVNLCDSRERTWPDAGLEPIPVPMVLGIWTPYQPAR